ncbi:MAG: hypothetical protein CSA07_04880 [Bacteroidia bacterium]|nr:MAG: hypothetical protein CSA07_04880 [Bacteroidia bacterium]
MTEEGAKGQQARTCVLNTAARLMRQRGIKPVTMSDIATESGTSKRTIYQMFADKETLIKCVLYEDVACAVPEDIRRVSNPVEWLLTVMRWAIWEASTTHHLFYTDLQRLYPELWREYYKRIHMLKLETTGQHVESGMRLGLLRRDVDPVFAAKLLVELSHAMVHMEAFRSGEGSTNAVAWEYVQIVMRGLATPEGISVIEAVLARPDTK